MSIQGLTVRLKAHFTHKVIRNWHFLTLAILMFGLALYFGEHHGEGISLGAIIWRLVDGLGDVVLDRGVNLDN